MLCIDWCFGLDDGYKGCIYGNAVVKFQLTTTDDFRHTAYFLYQYHITITGEAPHILIHNV